MILQEPEVVTPIQPLARMQGDFGGNFQSQRAGKLKLGYRAVRYEFLKRLFDLSLLLITVVGWLPVMLLCAAAIWLHSPRDPIFYKQKRTGRYGRSFQMLKFRTMVTNADELKEQLRSKSVVAWPDFKLPMDPRVTSVGRVLRKCSLDEFPQLINVLKGDMSLVGPRPTSFSIDTYEAWQTERLDVRPGITGLWQVYGRGEMEFDERSRLDIHYAHRRSLRLDIHILTRTFGCLLKGK